MIPLQKIREARAEYRKQLREATLQLEQLPAYEGPVFCEILNVLARELELTDGDIAELFETDRGTVNRWRHGKAAPPRHSRTSILLRLGGKL